MQIAFDGDRQLISGPASELNDALIFVLVKIGQRPGQGRFFILEQGQSRNIIHDNHAGCLAKHGGVCPRNPQSTHSAVSLRQLDQYRDNWALIESALARDRRHDGTDLTGDS